MTNTYSSSKQSHQLQASAAIVRHIKASSYRIIACCLEHQHILSTEGFLCLYYHWLVAALNDYMPRKLGVGVAQEFLYIVMLDDIARYALYGKRAKSFRHEMENQPFYAKGFIAASALELGHFIFDAWSDLDQAAPAAAKPNQKHYTSRKTASPRFSARLANEINRTFKQTWPKLAQELVDLHIDDPLLFFLEYFAKMLGWNAGALADLWQVPTPQFLTQHLSIPTSADYGYTHKK